MEAIVVIPVYKVQLTPGETLSLHRCLTVLKNHPIVLVTHASLNVSAYEKVFVECGREMRVVSFPSSFFKNVQGYNQLMLSRSFYQRFADYTYLLIYQLDGYVFNDQLTDWCRKGYDFVGAPVFRFHGSHEAGNSLWKVGNGGVSLRKTAAFLSLFDRPMPLGTYPFFIKNIRLKGCAAMISNTAMMGLKLLFYNHTIEYYLTHHCDSRINEDMFWCDALSHTKLALNVPSLQESAYFCFEKSPAYLYTLTQHTLPFCCHAFERYDYPSFWNQFITIN
ncbi:MAG: hypothetical protein BWY72_00294 [Bacteroidetes bacterium ADurb.Bin416]|nr:MAG: hypothetical protein BWY72_00294 [Bacteroidetes bacterium ADurb.Bin416]